MYCVRHMLKCESVAMRLLGDKKSQCILRDQCSTFCCQKSQLIQHHFALENVVWLMLCVNSNKVHRGINTFSEDINCSTINNIITFKRMMITNASKQLNSACFTCKSRSVKTTTMKCLFTVLSVHVDPHRRSQSTDLHIFFTTLLNSSG